MGKKDLDYGDSPAQSDEMDQPEKDKQNKQQNDESGLQEVGKLDMVSFPSAVCGGVS